MSEGAREYVSVKKVSNGVAVKVTLVEGSFTAGGYVHTYSNHVKEAVGEARKQATDFMAAIKEAVA